MRKYTILLITICFLSIAVISVSAKRLLPQAKVASGGGGVKSSGSVVAKVKFRSDRHAINITFSNLSAAKSVSYILTYVSNDVTQAATGAITSRTALQEVRDLLFGTCSSGTCRYDTNITDAKFVVTVNLNSGQKIVKTFRLKV